MELKLVAENSSPLSYAFLPIDAVPGATDCIASVESYLRLLLPLCHMCLLPAL